MALRAFSINPCLGGFGNESDLLNNQNHPQLERRTKKLRNCSQVSETKDSNSKHRFRSHIKKKAGKSQEEKNNGDSSCDAFAQIIKELVDNAADACSKSNHFDRNEDDSVNSRAELKRVRVRIDTHDEDNNSDSDSENEGLKFLRVTVSDNGCGMSDIESCVSAFSSSKSCSSSNDKEFQSRTNGIKEGMEKQVRTAGRYGIGLTLCLLHAQRLVPNSSTSITSATLSSSKWTRANFIIDTNKDAVVCIKKESLKKRKGKKESGTAVSLLVPGGIPAQKAWPRLAEYFARFQLSLELKCSLNVLAPSLSSIPLYIRPPLETETMELSRKEIQQRGEEISTKSIPKSKIFPNNILDKDEECGEYYWGDKIIVDDYLKNKNKDVLLIDLDQDNSINIDRCPKTCELKVKEKKISQNKIQDRNVKYSEHHWDDRIIIDEKDANKIIVLESLEQDNSINTDGTPKTCELKNKEKKNMRDEQRRKMIQKAASSYLNKLVDLQNIAYSIQPIRQQTNRSNSGNAYSKVYGNSPMLEVDVIVHGPEEEENDNFMEKMKHDGFNESSNSYEVDRHEVATIQTSDSHDNKSAKVLLVRMVNCIPLLDGAEASACGLVHGLMKNQSIWNSFGLEVSNCSILDKDLTGAINSPSITSELFIPTLSLRDSAQVSPFFSQDISPTLNRGSKIEDVVNDNNQILNRTNETSTKERRKQDKKVLFLPAGLRLGNILIILQLHAKPSELPLPTLSKGRIPMNDKSINEALEVGLRNCLSNLQKSNPTLLITSIQLRKNERDFRYIPSTASSLASLTHNCMNNKTKKRILHDVQRWNGLNLCTPTIPTNSFSFTNKSLKITTPTILKGNRCKEIKVSEPTLIVDKHMKQLEQKVTTQAIEDQFRLVLASRDDKQRQEKKKKSIMEKKRKMVKKINSCECLKNNKNSSLNHDLDNFLPHDYTNNSKQILTSLGNGEIMSVSDIHMNDRCTKTKTIAKEICHEDPKQISKRDGNENNNEPNSDEFDDGWW